VYLTDTRVVAVSGHFVNGKKAGATGFGNQFLLTAAAAKISNIKASREAADTFLVGQMRLPWITGVVFGSENASKNSRGELRLLGEHVTDFGDPEMMMMMIRLRHPAAVIEFVEELISRVKCDRLSWRDTKDDQRSRLTAIPSPRSIQANGTSLPMVSFPVAYRVGEDTASYGTNSMRSFSAG